jgi:hypothetical protein
MPKFSPTSLDRLATCDARLQRVFHAAVLVADCTIITGHRGQAEQDEAFRTGKSKVKWPEGKHNSLPAKAVDAAPYPIDWNDRERATLFAGFVLGLAHGMGIRLRWGGDWNGNWEVADNGFDDLWHFELVED